jgi:UDP-2,3-diacylglucosamine pyrophosphatase LpxH
MSIVLLHLSDIHIKNKSDKVLSVGKKIAAAVTPHLPESVHVFLVLSGDIAYSGKNEEYDLAKSFIDEVIASIKEETNIPISVIVTPGNHDCDFNKNTKARLGLISQIEKDKEDDVDDSIINICTSIQDAFFEFQQSVENHPKHPDDDKLWRTVTFTVMGKIVEFNLLNISWVSKLKEEPGHMLFPVNRYEFMGLRNAELRILVLHHPFNWFSQRIYRPFRKFVRNIADIIISGHEHQGNVGLIEEAESQKSAFVEGCVLQHDGSSIASSSFNIVVIDLKERKFKSTRYLWNSDHYAASEDGSWSEYHELPGKSISPFPINSTFQAVLDDPGGVFKHPSGQAITLADVYVFPDLSRASEKDGGSKDIISSSLLLQPEHICDGVVIEGEEKSGASSLLYRLYRKYHERGFLPVYVKGKDIKRATSDEIEGVVRRAYQNQYGKAVFEKISQAPRAKKVLFVDDFDDGQIRSAKARAFLLANFKNRFGQLVVTVSTLFEMREVLDGDDFNEAPKLKHFQLQPFGFKRRSEIIQRWFALGADGSEDEAAFISNCDKAERLMNGVMVKALVPSVPLYLLTLLQTVDSGNNVDFKESALGYYYQFLITRAFTDSGIKEDKLTEMFHYCSHLAWFFHLSNKKEILESEIRSFNEKFSNEWSTVDFSVQLNFLLNSRVLQKLGNEYSFRYPYLFYFLKGKFLSENLENASMRSYIENCCAHLYVRDYANTVLFLAHHTNDEFVLDSVALGLMTAFDELKPLAFNSDTLNVKKLIVEAPRLIYKGGKPASHRQRRTEIQDEMDDGHDGFADCEEKSTLSVISKLTKLFKTADILGQALKSQYSKIKRPRRTMLVEELISAPLRALACFYRDISINQDRLRAEIEATIKRKGDISDPEEQKSIARRIASELVQLFTFGFVQRAAQNVNSENLAENVSEVVMKNGSLAFRLVELAALLDSPKPIPRDLLLQIHKASDDDLIVARLIQSLVLTRLYMFKTNEGDMQWLSDKLDIRIKTQHSISYADSSRRLVK